ncbi:MAG: TolC family protein [Pirellulaceae bacterium]|nr:TolC family protein [Pirellulaceae bacterium]
MLSGPPRGAITAFVLTLAWWLVPFAAAQHRLPIIFPEQRTIDWRDPSQLPQVPLPPSSEPPTVSSPPTGDTRFFALDESIRIALANEGVVRVLTGTTAVSSGRTIYDTAITNTLIDQNTARFDPFVTVNNNWDHFDPPSALFIDSNNPLVGSRIGGVTTNDHRVDVSVTKLNPLGGEWRLDFNSTRQKFSPGLFPLNPQTTSNVDLSYNQPLLQGFGRPANMAPILVARINTEISFFQLKDAVQEQVRGVVEAYWNLVASRTTAWARRRQVEQAEFAYKLADARFRVQIDNGADVAQARVTLAQFRAQLIAADADVLQREGALRNILGLPPWDEAQLIPSTEPTLERFVPRWDELVELAAQRRPDLVELKLILEADEQLRIQANNNALPRLDAVALYRWNGLEGELPNGNGLSSGPGQFTDWTLGVNFSVPVGLRQSRAQLRQRELIIARDQANLQQGLHFASHNLATTVRNISLAYEQYLAFKEAREAARTNLNQQLAQFRAARVNYLNVLVAITDWGNAITNEAVAVASYNTQLAELERQTGTILETHGIAFYEERYGSIGPLGRLAHPVCYPRANPPTGNADRYPAGTRPAEQIFNLDDPTQFRVLPQNTEELPAPPPLPRGPGER